MKIEGIQKLTLLDFPGRVACTVFTPGCDFRCPFCHNADVVLYGEGAYPEEDFFDFLETRRGRLSGVAITGGEPLMQEDMPDFIRRIRELGFAVKLDTNGSWPERLRAIVEEGLVEYVAVDVKNCREKYAATSGLDETAAAVLLPRVYESIGFLMEGHVDFEFRTTVVKELHEDDDFRRIGEWLAGDEKFFLQGFSDSGNILSPGLSAHAKEDMERFAEILRPSIPKIALRGV